METTTRRFLMSVIFFALTLFACPLVGMENKYLPEQYRCDDTHCPSCRLLRAMPTVELCAAAAQADVERLRELLAESLNVNRSGLVGCMPPFCYAVDAALHGRPRAHEAMLLLVTHGADVNALGWWDEATPLAHAVDECDTNVMRELVRLGADLEWPCCSCRHSINERLSCECGRPTLLFRALGFSPNIFWQDTSQEVKQSRFAQRAVTLIECGARTDTVAAWDAGYLLHLKRRLQRLRARLAAVHEEGYEDDELYPYRSCYNLIKDAVRRRQAVDMLVGCDVARKVRTGQRLLPRELICHIATFLGIELPLWKFRILVRGKRKRRRSKEDA